MSPDILGELGRAKAYFQLRAICTAIGAPAPRLHQVNEQQPADQHFEAGRPVLPARVVVNNSIHAAEQ